MEYYLDIMCLVGIFAILAMSLNVICGMTGLLQLGHAGFYAVGAYAAGLVSIYWFNPGWGIGNFVISAIVAIAVSCFFALLIGIPCLRLRGDYLAIATLGFGEIVRITLTLLEYPDLEKQAAIQAELAAGETTKELAAIEMQDATIGGATGIEMPLDSLFTNMIYDSPYTNLIFISIFVIITFVLLWMMKRSTTGRALLAIRENELAAQAMGINVSYYKILSFVICAGFAGFAGALYAHKNANLVPNDFSLLVTINILLMVVLGGLGSYTGSFIAAAILVALPEALRFVPDIPLPGTESTIVLSENKEIIFALLLIILIRLVPNGLFGLKEFDDVIRKFTGGKNSKPPTDIEVTSND